MENQIEERLRKFQLELYKANIKRTLPEVVDLLINIAKEIKYLKERIKGKRTVAKLVNSSK